MSPIAVSRPSPAGMLPYAVPGPLFGPLPAAALGGHSGTLPVSLRNTPPSGAAPPLQDVRSPSTPQPRPALQEARSPPLCSPSPPATCGLTCAGAQSFSTPGRDVVLLPTPGAGVGRASRVRHPRVLALHVVVCVCRRFTLRDELGSPRLFTFVMCDIGWIGLANVLVETGDSITSDRCRRDGG
jgi:hypothetical protein